MATNNQTSHFSRPEHVLVHKGAAELCSQAPDLHVLLEAFGRLVIENLADFLSVDLVEDDGSIKRYLTLHASDGTRAVLSQEREQFPLGKTASYGYPRVIKTGKSQFIPGVTGHIADRLLSSAKSDMDSPIIVRSFICAPLVAHGRTLGAVTIANLERTAFFTAADLLLLEEICGLLAERLDRML